MYICIIDTAVTDFFRVGELISQRGKQFINILYTKNLVLRVLFHNTKNNPATSGIGKSRIAFPKRPGKFLCLFQLNIIFFMYI